MRMSALFGQKFSEFLKFMVVNRGQGGQFFAIAGQICGRLLWRARFGKKVISTQVVMRRSTGATV